MYRIGVQSHLCSCHQGTDNPESGHWKFTSLCVPVYRISQNDTEQLWSFKCVSLSVGHLGQGMAAQKRSEKFQKGV